MKQKDHTDDDDVVITIDIPIQLYNDLLKYNINLQEAFIEIVTQLIEERKKKLQEF
jgi:hypothetical protein